MLPGSDCILAGGGGAGAATRLRSLQVVRLQNQERVPARPGELLAGPSLLRHDQHPSSPRHCHSYAGQPPLGGLAGNKRLSSS